MIFVTTGTQAPFDRFIKAVDEIAPLMNEKIVAQFFKNNYEPKNIEHIDFIEPDKFDELIDKSRIIISHAGIGSIISALRKNKPLVIFPRIASLGEHRNDHQIATADKFKELELVYVAYNESELKKYMLSQELVCMRKLSDNASEQLVNSIKNFIG